MAILIVFTLAFSLSATASPQEPARKSLTSCMSRRMAGDRLISYNEAQKMCREQMKSDMDAKPETASNRTSKPVS